MILFWSLCHMSFVVLHDSHSFLLSVHVWNSGKEKLEQAAEEVARGDRSLTKLANFTSQFDVEILCQYLGSKGCKGFDSFYIYIRLMARFVSKVLFEWYLHQRDPMMFLNLEILFSGQLVKADVARGSVEIPWKPPCWHHALKGGSASHVQAVMTWCQASTLVNLWWGDIFMNVFF